MVIDFLLPLMARRVYDTSAITDHHFLNNRLLFSLEADLTDVRRLTKGRIG